MEKDSDVLKERLSSNLKKLRKEKDFSQFELAEKADVSDDTINSIEGRRLWPSNKTLLKIANALECDVALLFLPDQEETLAVARRLLAPSLAQSLRLALNEVSSNIVEEILSLQHT